MTGSFKKMRNFSYLSLNLHTTSTLFARRSFYYKQAGEAGALLGVN